MKVYLTSAYPYHSIKNFAVNWLRDSAILDSYKKHIIVNDPNDANVILFVEHHPPNDPYFFKVLKHPLVKRYKKKVIIHTDTDKPIALLPTISPSIEKSAYNSKLTASIHYIARHVDNDSVFYEKLNNPRKHLYSFIGSSQTHIIRKSILNLKYENSFLKDTSNKNLWKLKGKEKILFEKDYANISKSSYFVICPRGIGTNSYRLYETMEMGLTPVIISDDWIPSKGPIWEEFSIRIEEKNIHKIPELLLKRKKDAIPMGIKARENWEKWFSKDVSFHHIMNITEELHNNRLDNNTSNFFYILRQFLRYYHFKNFLRFLKTNITKKVTKLSS